MQSIELFIGADKEIRLEIDNEMAATAWQTIFNSTHVVSLWKSKQGNARSIGKLFYIFKYRKRNKKIPDGENWQNYSLPLLIRLIVFLIREN